VNVLMPKPYAELHQSYIKRYLDTRVPHILGKGKRIVQGKHRDGSEFPIYLDVNMWETAGRMFFSGIITRVPTETAPKQQLNAGVSDIQMHVDRIGM